MPVNIKAVTARDLKSNFKEIADDINDYDETAYLLATKTNRDRLEKAKASFESKDLGNKILTPEEFEKFSDKN